MLIWLSRRGEEELFGCLELDADVCGEVSRFRIDQLSIDGSWGGAIPGIKE